MSRCRWPECSTQVTPDLWGCKSHWFTLPKSIRDRIWHAYRNGTMEQLSAAHQEAQDWIGQRGAHAKVDCRSCGRPLIYLPTKAGKSMPCNAETVAEGDTTYQHGKHISHFSDCPAAASFRKPKEKTT